MNMCSNKGIRAKKMGSDMCNGHRMDYLWECHCIFYEGMPHEERRAYSFLKKKEDKFG